MKKQVFSLLFVCMAYGLFAQETTLNAAFYKVKLTERPALYKAMAEHNAKFRPAGSPLAIAVYNITGGLHNGEILILSNIGLSFKDRDKASTSPAGMSDDLYANVLPHFEAITDGDVMVYEKNYSSSDFSERTDKILNTIFTIKEGAGREFWDIVKKFPKAWEKSGLKIAAYVPITGSSRLVLSQRLPEGWSELDEKNTFSSDYEAIYGKGSLERDAKLFFSYILSKETMMMSLNRDISSK